MRRIEVECEGCGKTVRLEYLLEKEHIAPGWIRLDVSAVVAGGRATTRPAKQYDVCSPGCAALCTETLLNQGAAEAKVGAHA